MASQQCSECSGSLPRLSSESEETPDWNINVTTKTLARHQELLSTNTPPEDAELTFIRAVLSDTGARLADIEREMSRLRDRLRQLEDERSVMSIYHAQNRAILSPLRRMPPEVLGEIFSWTLPTLRPTLRRGFDVNDSPWVLTHICSRWRAIAISTPTLWSLLTIKCSDKQTDSLAMAKTHIERAHMLQIHFWGEEINPVGPQIEMFRFLAEYSPRWEEFRIQLTSDLSALLPSLRNRVPLLRRLRIQWGFATSSAEIGSIDCFQIAPALLDVGLFNGRGHVPISLPLHQLTRYRLHAPCEMHRDMVKLGHNLVEAHIDVRGGDWPDSSNAINLFSLRRLYVSHSKFLNYLRVPSLEELAIWFRKDSGPTILEHVESLLARSSCAPHRLCFQGSLDTHTVTELLRKVPSIVELAIIVPNPGTRAEVDGLMAALTIHYFVGSPPVAPQLRGLFFGCPNQTSIDYAVYLLMLQTRWKARDSALKAAALLTDLGPGPDPATIEGLQSLREEGLDLMLLRGVEARYPMDRWMFG